MKNMFYLISFAILSFLFFSCGDPCDDVVCLNSGTCLEGDCICPEGFTGDNCETTCLETITGVWVVEGNFNSNCDFLTYEFSAGSADSLVRVRINSTYIPAFVEGTGVYSDGCLTINYEIDSGNFGGEITFDQDTLTDRVPLLCTIKAVRE